MLTILEDEWSFSIRSGASLGMSRVKLLGTFTSDFGALSGTLTGAATFCSLAKLPFLSTSSTLDALVNDPSLAAAVAPDLDLDGDGIEQVIGDGVSIARCIDGDGVTVIEGVDCPCHPAIADGYSISMAWTAVPATILDTR